MKRKIFLLVVIVVCLCLCACSERNGDVTDSNPISNEDTSISESAVELPIKKGPTEEELEDLFKTAMHEINELSAEDPCDYIGHIFSGVKIDQEDCVIVDQIPYARTSLNYNELVEYYGNIFVDEPLEWILSTKFVNVEDMVYCSIIGGQTGGYIQLLSIAKLQGNTYKALFKYYYGENEAEEKNSVFEIKKIDAGYRISSIDYRPASLK